jgi:hypothetical protein
MFIINTVQYLHCQSHQDRLQVVKQNIFTNDLILNTILFTDDKIIMASTADELKRAVYTLNNVAMAVLTLICTYGSDTWTKTQTKEITK